MKQYYILDQDGFLDRIVLIQEGEEIPENSTDILPSYKDGKTYYKPKFIDGEWIEGASQEEITIMITPQTEKPVSVDEQNAQLAFELMSVQDKLDIAENSYADLMFALMEKGVL
ncbi:hypothetical protein [Niallia sp. 03190]|uniref:hypothetical protein n=1 Tax=Niallia sp. 03190 TaxID=3458061 RepID=UPI0040446CE3